MSLRPAALLFLVAALACAQQSQVDPAIEARIEGAFAAWHQAADAPARSLVRQKWGPFDPDFMKYLSFIGEQFQKKGDFAGATDRFRFCAEESDLIGDNFHSSICWQLIGGVERLQGRYAESEAHYLTAIAFARKPGGERRLPIVTNNLAALLISQTRYTEGVEMLNQVLNYNRAHNILDDPAPYQNLAIAHALRGDNQRAHASFLTALSMYEKAGDTKKLGLTHYNLGVLEMNQSNYDAAAHEFELGIGFSTKTGDNTQIAQTLGDLGRARDFQGRTAEALETLQKARDLCRTLGFRVAYANALLNLGNFHLRHEALAPATAALAEAREIAEKELHDGITIGSAIRGQGFIAYRQGDFARAATYAEQAAQNARTLGDPLGEWQSATLAGLASQGLRKTDDARRNFNFAIELVEKSRRTVSGGDLEKQRFFEEAVFPYRQLALLEAEAGNNLAALAVAERARARVLLDVLAAGPEPIDKFMTEPERTEEIRLRAAVAIANSRLSRAVPARVQELSRERDTAWQSYETFLRVLYTNHPELRSLRGESPLAGAADLASLVATPGAAIVEYLAGQNELLQFVVTRGSDLATPRVSVHRIPVSRDALAKRVERFRAMLEGRDPAFRSEARALYDLLLGSGRELQKSDHVRVIPDGPLWGLPFQALLDPAGRYWVESATLSFAHSVTFLKDQKLRPLTGKPETELVLLANPALRDQAQRVAAPYRDSKPLLLLGSEAEIGFKQRAPGARILHVAAHGVVDPVNGLHSRLLLTSSDSEKAPGEDGWLEAWELMQLRLRADLVVLSACETGKGRSADGEGLLGLTWALFAAGAKSAIVSQWRVEADSTTDLMVGLHERLRKGTPAAEALRGSVLALMKDPARRHPMYWAPFIYSGQ